MSQRAFSVFIIVGIVTAIFLLGFGSFVGYTYWQKQSNLNETQQNSIHTKIRSDLSTWNSQYCHISFQYPRNWELKLNSDKETGCFVQIKPQGAQDQLFSLNSMNTSDWQKILAEHPNANPITIGETEGIQEILDEDQSGKVLGIYFRKGTMLFSIMSVFPNDGSVEAQHQAILNSITFTGSGSDYQVEFGKPRQLQVNAAQDAKIKADLGLLKDAILYFYQEYGHFPASLNELKESGALSGTFPEHPVVSKTYTYALEKNSFTLGAELSDGTAYGIKHLPFDQ